MWCQCNVLRRLASVTDFTLYLAGKPTYDVRCDDCQPHQKLAVRSFISMRSVQGYCIWLKQVYGLPKDPTLHARNQTLFAGQTGSSSMTAYLVSTERRVI